MATQADTLQHIEPAAARGWLRWLSPSFFDLVVISLPIWFFGLADGGVALLLSDLDAGWHVRTGDWILSHRQFVFEDLFSFTRPGQPWFAWEWLSDVIFSLLHSAMGIKGLLLFGILMGTAFCGLIFRHMVWRGANVFIALPLALLGFGASTAHLLSRPHLWTMVFIAGLGWLIESDLRRPSGRIWLLIPFGVLWTNLHGGWLAGVVVLGLVAAGTALESLFGNPRWEIVRRYALLAAGCFAVSIVNPYGWKLHVHMYGYLTNNWIKELVSEFKSPSFRGENMMQFEIVLLMALVAAGLSLSRKRFVGPLLALFWAHSALVSARHLTIFAALALPLIAEEFSRAWTAWAGGAKKSSVQGILHALGLEAQPGLARLSVWPAAAFGVVALPVLNIPWPTDFPSLRVPVRMVEKHHVLLETSRVYAVDQWADYLIYKGYPRQRVFFDGRSDFYGETISREYCKLLSGEHDWRELMDKYGFDAVLVRPKLPLASLLKLSPDWRIVDDDGDSILFRKRTRGEPAAKSTVAGANEKP